MSTGGTGIIGGSDIAKIMDQSPWGGPFSAWLRIVQGQEQKESDVLHRGNDFEPVIRNRFVRETGFALKDKRDIPAKHSKYEFVGGTPDDMTTTGLVVEYKTSSPFAKHGDDWGDDGTDKIPKHYALQCAWYMFLTNAPEAQVGVLFSLDSFKIYKLKRDAALEEKMIEAASKFWVDHVKTGKPPPPDASKEARKWTHTNNKDSAIIVAADAELNTWVERYRKAKEENERSEKELDLCVNNIEHKLAGALAANGDGWKLSNPTVYRAGGVNWESIARKFCPADLIAEEIDGNRKPQVIYKRLTIKDWTKK